MPMLISDVHRCATDLAISGYRTYVSDRETLNAGTTEKRNSPSDRISLPRGAAAARPSLSLPSIGGGWEGKGSARGSPAAHSAPLDERSLTPQDYTLRDPGGEADDATRASAARVPTPPACVRDDELCRLWHKLDRTYKMPKTIIMVSLRTPVAGESPESCVSARVGRGLRDVETLGNETTRLRERIKKNVGKNGRGTRGSRKRWRRESWKAGNREDRMETKRTWRKLKRGT